NYITTTGHIYDSEVYIMNEEFYNGLSEEDQEIIQSSIDDAVEFLRERNSEYEDELIEMLEEEGAVFRDLSEEEQNVWIDSAIPFYEEHADDVDKDKL